MPSYRVISSDSHIIEPPGMWADRIEPRFRGREPTLVKQEMGNDVWFCDGQEMMDVVVGTQAGKRFEDQQKTSLADAFDNVILGGFIPDEHVKDLDIDGVEADVLYPSMGLFLYTVQDQELLNSVLRNYNDWLSEFCNAYPKRLKGIAMINVVDVDEAVKELKRCANMGLAGAMSSVYLPWGEPYSGPQYDSFWAAAQDLQMPISLHAGSNSQAPGQHDRFGGPKDPRAAKLINRDHWVREDLADLIFDGIFERYPKLKVGSVEFELSWAAHFIDRLDYTYTQRAIRPHWIKFKNDMLPSDFFHRNVFVSFQDDGLGIRLRDMIGIDTLMWGSDYPHIESTFPKSLEVLEEILSDCTGEEKAKIAGRNVAKLYHID